ncbi:helix-turn-helix domain-containing protein [Candidatus Gottesmanbacteria bacterium]|nr:helix-turn-helix domain-containing protein [Candidatus Gottesmanbacteria bacterium]
MNNNIIKDFLLNLGLTPEESAIYSTLLEKGPQTVLEISRNSGLDRTGVYRHLEKLQSRGIIEEIIDENRKMYAAADMSALEFLVKEKENQVRKLQESLPLIDKIITSREGDHQPGTKVLFYRGKDGIKQQVWNTLRADKICLGYTYRKLGELIGDFYIRWLDEWVARKLLFRDIYSDDYLKSLKVQTINPHIPPGHFESRYISPDVLNINHQYDIYNDVISIYNWHEGEVFGVEIYNQKIADMQRQLFEIVWQSAEPR